MQNMAYRAQHTSPLASRARCSRGVPSVGCMHLSVTTRPTAVDKLEGCVGCCSKLMWGPALCDCDGCAGGKAALHDGWLCGAPGAQVDRAGPSASPPLIPSIQVVTVHQAELPVLYTRFLGSYYLLYPQQCTYVSSSLPVHPTTFPSRVHTSVPYVSVSIPTHK